MGDNPRRNKMPEDTSIVICGQAGQGIKTVEALLLAILKGAGLNVFACREYMSRIRGGMNSTSIRFSAGRVRAPVNRIDVLVALDRGSVSHLRGRISPDTLVLGDEETIPGEDIKTVLFRPVPWSGIAEKIGAAYYANTVATGALAGLLGCDRKEAAARTRDFFSAKSDKIRDDNLLAMEEGYKIGRRLGEKLEFKKIEAYREQTGEELLLSGTEAVALGAIAGGCDFLSFYPMSPATGVGVFLSGQSEDFGIEVEQAEDEIAAVNMALGAWYAGGRAMVSTSGGGFALMAEGLSLAGMIESPLVIHLGQRPGPATGLPTRTEQGDLLFAAYAGHGEFPRIILAPGSIGDAFELARESFNLADRYQVPVIILTDQFLLDAQYNLPPPETGGFSVVKHIVKTAAGYRRYAFAGNGISPRGIPGWGDGLVAVDSDEHDEAGRITEDSGVRVRMVDKRLKKLRAIRAGIPEPEFFGDRDYSTLILSWGSTRNAIRESLEEAGAGTGCLHFRWVYPLWPKLEKVVREAKRLLVIENNATSQFGMLVKLHTGREADGSILKYDGMPFSVEELAAGIKKEIPDE